MKLRFLAASLCVLGAAAASAQQNAAPAALLSAVSATQGAKAPYAFDIAFESSRGHLRAHFDPSKTPKVTLLSPAETSLNGDERKAYDALQHQLDGVSWCAGERIGNITDVQLLREDANTATYSFQPTRESMHGQAAQYADHLRGEITLTKTNPDVASLHIYLPEAFDPLPLVHIASFDVAVTCAAAPNGRRYAAQTVAATTGNALGQDLNERTVQNVSNLSPAA